MPVSAIFTGLPGVALLVSILGSILGRRRLSVGEDGILDRSLPLGVIRWNEIDGVFPPTARDAESVYLRLRLSRRIARRLRRQGPPDAGARNGGSTLDVRLDLRGTGITGLELVQRVLSTPRTAGRDSDFGA